MKIYSMSRSAASRSTSRLSKGKMGSMLKGVDTASQFSVLSTAATSLSKCIFKYA